MEGEATKACKVQETSDTGTKGRAGLQLTQKRVYESCNMQTFNVIIAPERPRS